MSCLSAKAIYCAFRAVRYIAERQCDMPPDGGKDVGRGRGLCQENLPQGEG